MKFINQAIFVSLSSFVLLSPVYANKSYDYLVSAQRYIDKKDPESAYKLLKTKHKANSKNTQEWFLLGISAQQLGKPREAKSYLKKVVELDPDNADRAKLELARLAYILRDADEAQGLLASVKEKNPPENVKKNIEQFEKTIDEKGVPRTWKLHASAGYMYDSNANAGPLVDSVLMFGLPFTLSDDAKGNSDNAVVLSAGISDARSLTDSISLQSNLSVNSTNYRTLDKLDSFVVSGSAGLTKKVNNQLMLSLPLVADKVKVGHEDSYYSYSYGIAPWLNFNISEKAFLSVNTTWSKKKFKDKPERETDSTSISPVFGYKINDKSIVKVALTAGQEKSDLDYFSNKSLGMNSSYLYTFKNGVQASLSTAYIDKKYDGKETAYNEARHDKSTRVTLNLSYKIKRIDSALNFSISDTHNKSNLDIYEYDRSQASLSLSKSF